VFPQYHEGKRSKGDISSALNHPEDIHQATSEWQPVSRTTASKVEFFVLQVSSVVFAGTVGTSLRPEFGVLQLLGIACIEFFFIGISLRVIKYIRGRTEVRVAEQGIGNNEFMRRRDWRLTIVKSAPIGLYSGIIAADVHPFMAQLGALYIGLIIVGDVILLWQHFLKKM
jgi:hypothetical protein